MLANKKTASHKANFPDEILDLVDKNDKIIGEIVRAEANSDPKLFHREVGVLGGVFKNRH